MNNVPQGASLALERISPTLFNFWLKKSKKKLSGMKMTYDPKEDKFALGDEDVFTFSLPNKIIHLERETLTKLFFYYQQRDDLDLRELLTLIFKNFGLESENFSLHYLRAYHLVDILRLTTQEEVEKILLSSPEFIPSEKKKGIFFYQEKVRIEEEARPEELEEILPEAPAEEAPPSAQTFEETPSPEFEVEIEGVRVEAPSEILRAGIEKKEKREKPRISKKEKLPRKKRQILEGEKDIRARKGVKKFIEEKIEIEESEQEAYIAIKAKEKKETEEEKKEALPKEERPDYKPFVPKEPAFGIFAEKLKTALGEKKKEKK
jgi:hypothetical protein